MERRASYYFTILSLGFILTACGGAEQNTTAANNGVNTANADVTSGLYSSAIETLSYERANNTSNSLIQVTRNLLSNQYDAIEPLLAPTDANVQVITGIGLDAKDYVAGKPMTISLGIYARQYDANTNSFSSAVQLFSAQGEDLSGGQTFSITNTNTPNLVLSGLALKLREGTITNLQLQQKTLADINSDAAPISAGKMVVLPDGWAVVGFTVRFNPSTTVNARVPFLSDILFYTGAIETK